MSTGGFAALSLQGPPKGQRIGSRLGSDRQNTQLQTEEDKRERGWGGKGASLGKTPQPKAFSSFACAGRASLKSNRRSQGLILNHKGSHQVGGLVMSYEADVLFLYTPRSFSCLGAEWPSPSPAPPWVLPAQATPLLLPKEGRPQRKTQSVFNPQENSLSTQEA